MPTPVQPEAVPAALAAIRKASGLAVADLARALGFEGANAADRLREIERGARPASGTVRQLLAYMLRDIAE